MTTPLAWVLAGMQDSNPDVASRTRSRTHIARIVTRIAVEDKSLTILVQWCVGSRRAATCAFARVLVTDHKAKRHSHRTGPLQQQSGRTPAPLHLQTHCRQGFDVQEVCVQGVWFAVTANVASQSRLKSWRRQLVVQCALRLL